jgi:hypothetical protein
MPLHGIRGSAMEADKKKIRSLNLMTAKTKRIIIPMVFLIK